MLEHFIDALIVVWTFVGVVLEHAGDAITLHVQGGWAAIKDVRPTSEIVLAVQLFVGLLTVVWIIFQFAWLRRLNEARLERHLEGTISAEREELADERTTTLAELERVKKLKGPRWFVVYCWAHARLTVSLIVRILSFGSARGLADHNILLMKAGAEERARGIFTDIARDAIKKIKLYKEAIDNKTLEAQNALIFAGRVALVEGRSAAAVMLFDTAKNLKDDVDARLLIGRQMFVAGAHEQAMREYEHVLAQPDITNFPVSHAEAHRSLAEVLLARNARVRARTALGEADNIETQHQLHAGLGKTKEMIGDIHAPRRDRRRAAREAFVEAQLAFERAGMPEHVRRVKRKLAGLEGEEDDVPEPRLIPLLESWGNWMLRQAAMRRARARRKVD